MKVLIMIIDKIDCLLACESDRLLLYILILGTIGVEELGLYVFYSI